MKKSEAADDAGAQGVLQRAFAVLRVLSDAKGEKLRLTDIAARTGQAQATVHRVLQGLVQEGMVEQPAQSKGYQLSVAFFSLAAAAGNHQSTLRSIYRPVMLRLSGMLNDTIFLLVRSGFDAVCLDRIDGAFPVRSHTGDIGGRVPLGLGQAGLLLLASGAALAAQLFFGVNIAGKVTSWLNNDGLKAYIIIAGVLVVLIGVYCLLILFRH